MEDAAFLVPMQRIVGGIKVEDDLLGGLLVGIEEEIDEQALDGGWVMADLVIACRFGAAPPDCSALVCRPAAQDPLAAPLAGQNRQHRVMAQLIVVVQVLIAKRDADDALHHQGLDMVVHQLGATRLAEAGGQTARSAGSPGRSDPAAARRHPR